MWFTYSCIGACLVLLVLLFGYLTLYRFRHQNKWRNQSRPDHIRIIHLMYLPWDKNQQLKRDDPYSFDMSYYHDLCRHHPDWDIRMWTLPVLQSFVQEHYPEVWTQAMERYTRPTQLVDLFRWLVVYHYGGIYVQYESELLIDLVSLLPSPSKHVRLFTERVLTDEQCQQASKLYRIRQGVPEENIRVMNQCFSASRIKDPFIELIWKTILGNLSIKPLEDHDVIYLTANSLISRLYDQVGQHLEHVELVDESSMKTMIRVSSKGSWRTDKTFKSV